jgi:hypothetical protein
MTELLNMTPTYLAALGGVALLLLGFLTPTRFAGVEVQWTRPKSLGCLLAGLLILSFVGGPALTNTALVDRAALTQIKNDAQKGIDAIMSARSGNSYPWCFDKATEGLAPLNDTLAILKKLGTAK